MSKILAMLAALTLSGCATIIMGSSQEVHFKTNPPGLIIKTNSNQCVTPCTMKVPRHYTMYRMIHGPSNTHFDYEFEKSVTWASYLNFFNYGIGYLLIDMQPNGGAYSIKDVDIDFEPILKASAKP